MRMVRRIVLLDVAGAAFSCVIVGALRAPARAGAAASVNDHVSSHRPFRNRQPSAKALNRVRMGARRNSEPLLVGRLADGTPFFAPLGTVVRDREERVQCHLCGRFLRVVGGTHLRVGHGWTLDAYREAFELLQREPTCSLDLSHRYRSDAHARLGTRWFGRPSPSRHAIRRHPLLALTAARVARYRGRAASDEERRARGGQPCCRCSVEGLVALPDMRS